MQFYGQQSTGAELTSPHSMSNSLPQLILIAFTFIVHDEDGDVSRYNEIKRETHHHQAHHHKRQK